MIQILVCNRCKKHIISEDFGQHIITHILPVFLNVSKETILYLNELSLQEYIEDSYDIRV